MACCPMARMKKSFSSPRKLRLSSELHNSLIASLFSSPNRQRKSPSPCLPHGTYQSNWWFPNIWWTLKWYHLLYWTNNTSVLLEVWQRPCKSQISFWVQVLARHYHVLLVLLNCLWPWVLPDPSFWGKPCDVVWKIIEDIVVRCKWQGYYKYASGMNAVCKLMYILLIFCD